MALSFHVYADSDSKRFGEYISRTFYQAYILNDPRYIDWQYGNTLLLATQGEEIIGHFGFRDMSYKLHDRVVPVRVLMNFFIEEKYRMTGIAALMAQRIFDTATPIFVSGYTPVAEKLFSHLRPQWNNAGTLRRFIAVLNPEAPLFAGYAIPFQSQAISSVASGDISVSEGTPSSEFFDVCWKRVNSCYGVTIERSSAYVEWRFTRHPFFSYTFITAQQNGIPCGYIIARIEEDQGFRIARIIDCIASSNAQIPLLVEFMAFAKRRAASAADFLLSGSLYDSSLVFAGFFDVAGTDFERFPILFSPLSSKKISINIGYDFAVPFDDCFMTKADGDQDRPNPF